MKFAFVGKGGSGKSTISALFVKYLEKSNRNTLVVDADINMNLAGLLDVLIEPGKFLSHPDVARALRSYFRGTNRRIKDVSQYLPTTPAGTGSNLVKSVEDPELARLGSTVSKDPLIRLLTVGTYDAKGIGETCYHSHLFVAENLLSHTLSDSEFHVVCDMVAGTDAFAYSMHLQFDGIFLIAEPSPESVEVCKLYLDLAKESGVADLVHVVGNKIQDQEDLEYVVKAIGKELLQWFPALPALKKARQQGRPIDCLMIDQAMDERLSSIEAAGLNPRLSNQERVRLLEKLHLKLNGKQWVQSGYGDVSGQIDPYFQFPALQGTGTRG
ncbi:ATP-binding protein [bacterium]|nr:ATP-binding protein [bacterium]